MLLPNALEGFESGGTDQSTPALGEPLGINTHPGDGATTYKMPGIQLKDSNLLGCSPLQG